VRVQEHDRFPPVPYGDTTRYSVCRAPLCMLLGFLMLFTSDGSSTNLQVP
jgi:hypothetical protein